MTIGGVPLIFINHGLAKSRVDIKKSVEKMYIPNVDPEIILIHQFFPSMNPVFFSDDQSYLTYLAGLKLIHVSQWIGFHGKILTGHHVFFSIKYRGFRLKFSHHPIL